MIAHRSGSKIEGQYEVVIGPAENPRLQGGFGQVYFCTDHAQYGRPVALKTFRTEFLSRRRVRDAFLGEGTVWIGLGHHPHIVPAYQVLRVGDGREVYVVIEWIAAAAGKALDALCADQGSRTQDLFPHVELEVLDAERWNREGGKLDVISASVTPPELAKAETSERGAGAHG